MNKSICLLLKYSSDNSIWKNLSNFVTHYALRLPYYMKELQTLFLFEPYFKSVIWGGEKIAALKRLAANDEPIGESWEISAVPGFESVVAEGKFKGLRINELISRYGEALVGRYSFDKWGHSFPILVKFIDARESLSIQVHPDEELAGRVHNSRGKTEMWYVMDAAPGSVIYSGWNKSMDKENFRKKSADGSILNSLASFPVKKGQFYFIPAGTVHAIGEGVMVAEIQETSDISYRIYDYNRKDNTGRERPLHIEAASKAVNLSEPAQGPLLVADDSTVVSCEFFKVDYISPTTQSGRRFDAAEESFSILMALHDGIDCMIAGEKYHIPVGSTALIPACVSQFEIISKEPFLLVSMPPLTQAK